MLLLLGAVARAQPAPSRAHRERSITGTGNPADPLPEVRGAKGIGITFHFDGPIRAYTPDDLDALTKDLPQPLKVPLCKLLARSRSERFQTAGAGN